MKPPDFHDNYVRIVCAKMDTEWGIDYFEKHYPDVDVNKLKEAGILLKEFFDSIKDHPKNV